MINMINIIKSPYLIIFLCFLILIFINYPFNIVENFYIHNDKFPPIHLKTNTCLSDYLNNHKNHKKVERMIILDKDFYEDPYNSPSSCLLKCKQQYTTGPCYLA